MSLDNQIVVGMSGHIDHGKTALVKALTGKNTDNLKQERERGMTIDLGFAFLDSQITIIDVPGHEKFVKNMMSGSSGIDIGILVIAADDGIMPQTLEHFEILKLLDIKYGFIVLNKIDLIDEDWLQLVKGEIEELVDNTFMSDAKILEVSAINGSGVEEVKNEIIALSKNIPQRKSSGIFRMHIDRVFTKTGFGTVVTGTIFSGSINVGDSVELLPSKQLLKVRNIQTHGIDVENAIAGQRAAINLNNISSSDLSRGYHLSKANTFNEVDSFISEITLINKKKYNIKNNQRVRIHLGTKEVMARISIISEYKNDTNDKLFAQIRLENKLVVGIEDRFIIRSYSPVITIAGGIVFDKSLYGSWKEVKEHGLNLMGKKSKERIFTIIDKISLENPLKVTDIENRLSISIDEFKKNVLDHEKYKIINYNSISWITSIQKINSLKNKIKKVLESFHLENPMSKGCNKKILCQKTNSDEYLLSRILDDMLKDKIIKNDSNFWSIYDFNMNVSSDQEDLKKDIHNYISKNELLELKNKEILLDNDINKETLFGIINLLESEKLIIRINPELVICGNKLNMIKESILLFFDKNNSMSVPEFKKITSLTRKFSIPLLEYLDKINFTYRSGDKRKLLSGENE